MSAAEDRGLAELTGRGSSVFPLGGQKFTARAVSIGDYLAWSTLAGEVGTEEHAAWYARHLAPRLKASRNAPTIDAAWVLDNVRVTDLPHVENALFEEIPWPEDAPAPRRLTLGGAAFRLEAYTLREYGEYSARLRALRDAQLAAYQEDVEAMRAADPDADLPDPPADPERPLGERVDELARALRFRLAGGATDPATITADWVYEHLTRPVMAALELFMFTGKTRTEAAPAGASAPKP